MWSALALLARGGAGLWAALPASLGAIWSFATSRGGSLLLVAAVAYTAGWVRADRAAAVSAAQAKGAAELAAVRIDLAAAQAQAEADRAFAAREVAARADYEKRMADYVAHAADGCRATDALVRSLRDRPARR